jgi:hypothetical protein
VKKSIRATTANLKSERLLIKSASTQNKNNTHDSSTAVGFSGMDGKI